MTALRERRALRWLTIALLVVVTAGAVRQRASLSGAALVGRGETRTVAEPSFPGAKFRHLGAFTEPLGDLDGYVLASTTCRGPIGVLPVPASFSAISPAELRWREGTDRAQYVYEGAEHGGRFVGLSLSASNIANRALAAFGLRRHEGISYYFKVWVPADCPPLTVAELREVAAGVSGEGG